MTPPPKKTPHLDGHQVHKRPDTIKYQNHQPTHPTEHYIRPSQLRKSIPHHPINRFPSQLGSTTATPTKASVNQYHTNQSTHTTKTHDTTSYPVHTSTNVQSIPNGHDGNIPKTGSCMYSIDLNLLMMGEPARNM
jgi:hypothetical protein